MNENDATNKVTDQLYELTLLTIRLRQLDEFEEVHNGSGRSEELPGDLQRRHAQELFCLAEDRRQLSAAEWVVVYAGS